MARIANPNDISVVHIRAFQGLNENPDGETTLKVGEFSRMWNFRVTKDGHLQKRPGAKKLLKLPGTGSGLFGAWHGTVGGEAHTLVNYAGTVFDVDLAAKTCRPLGQADQNPTHFFGFGDKVYLLDGARYAAWDGKTGSFQEVEGYIPLIRTATTPGGSGTKLENVNRLTGKRRVEFSPDGEADTFHLPETGIDEVVAVTLVDAALSNYSVDKQAGTVKLAEVPAAGTNTLEIIYPHGGRPGEPGGVRELSEAADPDQGRGRGQGGTGGAGGQRPGADGDGGVPGRHGAGDGADGGAGGRSERHGRAVLGGQRHP